ncbi:MAG TPA: hypothetical protein VFW96_22745 [Thermomicrobiales bacterium]|nr:hypothetical protein [Thermomicrobiales bacterium]
MTIVLGLHSFWRWVVLVAVFVALVRGLAGWVRGGAWTRGDRLVSMLAVTTIDIQFILGAILWIGQHRWNDGAFFGIVHPVVMILALVVAHIGNTRLKALPNPIARYRTMAISLLVVIILIAAAIPPDSWSKIWA